jgi:hypothetical protein
MLLRLTDNRRDRLQGGGADARRHCCWSIDVDGFVSDVADVIARRAGPATKFDMSLFGNAARVGTAA